MRLLFVLNFIKNSIIELLFYCTEFKELANEVKLKRDR